VTGAAEALRACAEPTRRDGRGARVATRALWARLHAEAYRRDACLRVIFGALADECGVGDPVTYLGPALGRMTAEGRADALLRAADALGSR